MAYSPASSGKSSPVKSVSISRGTNRVTKPAQLSPSHSRQHRFLSTKHVNALRASRKPSNPLDLPPSRLKLAAPPVVVAGEEDEWQDVEAAEKISGVPDSLPDPVKEPVKDLQERATDLVAAPNESELWPQLPPPEPSEHSFSQSSYSRDLTVSDENQSIRQPRVEEYTSSNDSFSNSTATLSQSSGASSFLGFSPSQVSSRFIRSLGEQSRRFRPLFRHNVDPVTPERRRGSSRSGSPRVGSPRVRSPRSGSPRRSPRSSSPHHRLYYIDQSGSPMGGYMGPQPAQSSADYTDTQPQYTGTEYTGKSHSTMDHLKAFWTHPSTPGMLALYLQVGFNLMMLGSLMYALAIFYLTIKNDVNIKVEEYAMDVVDQIAQCTHEYIRNNCEPSKRVPAMESACQQWERCMNKNPQEIGRAKVSAETFGTIIDAFFQPIGIKSMVFLVAGFAGSFLLVNGVFSSRLGPRFSSYPTGYNDMQHQHSGPHPPPPPPSNLQQQQQSIQQQQQQQQQQSYIYTSQIFSPSHIVTPRQPSPIRASLQSSPLRQQPYMDYYD